MKIPKIFLILLISSLVLSSLVSCGSGFEEGLTSDLSQKDDADSEDQKEDDISSSDDSESSTEAGSSSTVTEDTGNGSDNVQSGEGEDTSVISDEITTEIHNELTTQHDSENLEETTLTDEESSTDGITPDDSTASSGETSSEDETTPIDEITSSEEETSVTESSSAEQEETSTKETSSNDETTSAEEETTTEDPEITMTFSGSSCQVSDLSKVSVSGKIFTITAPGIYRISGTLSDGQIRVNVAKTEKVTLLLDNFNGSCSDSGVIYVVSADEVYIDLEKNSINTVTDASVYVFEGTSDKPNACIYSSDDLTIKGGGTLTVNANYNNGIGCKNDLVIKNGVVNVTAVKNALKGNDSVTVKGDAEVNVLAAKDGIKTDNITETDKGFVMITEEAVINITCSDDALQATQNVTVTSGATVTVKCDGLSVNCDGTTNNIADGAITVL